MKIKELSIKNIKSFRDKVTLQFDERFNILIGPNGGGKSNLLDIITIVNHHFFIRGYSINDGNDQGQYFKDINQQQSFRQIDKVLEKYIGDNSNSEISITYKLTKGDIENLKSIKSNKHLIEDSLQEFRNKPLNNIDFCKTWDFRRIKENSLVTYKIENNRLTSPKANSLEKNVLDYLNYIELLLILTVSHQNIKLKPVFLYFSPSRGVNENDLNTNLSAENYYHLLVNYFNSTSKSTTSLIKLATNYFGTKRRTFESDPKKGYESLWNSDDEVKLVTKYLKRLNYDWNLKSEDPVKNIFSISLQINGQNFLIQQASSGEKEIINFLLGIFAFNIKHGLIVIDEPELHLHPKWQNALIDLFLSISNPASTDNQFILSTHSPIFINNKTVANAIRIYKNSTNSSTTVNVESKDLGTTKDLLHIINTHNNQKIFFADKVILVEGIHDRIVFEKLTQHLTQNSTEVIEVVEVHSKNNLKKYRKFLDTFKIQNFLIADRDYLIEVGIPDVKKLFQTNLDDIDKKVIKSKKSEDRKAISRELEQAINTKDIKKLKELWKYIKNRILTFKEKPTTAEKKVFVKNVDNLKKNENILILSIGEIEDYLPDGFKKLDQTLLLVQEKEFTKWLKRNSPELKELLKITQHIIDY